MLATIEPVLKDHLRSINKSPPEPPRAHISSSFVPAGAPLEATNRRRVAAPLLHAARDWKLLVDFDHAKILFPPEICATNERPDIIIWSTSARHVSMIELTCPAEEGIRERR